MSDTVIFGKTVTGAFKSVLIYTLISIIISSFMGIGAAMSDMDETKWQAMWWMKRCGWWMLLAGNVLGNAITTFKAALSNSTRPPQTP